MPRLLFPLVRVKNEELKTSLWAELDVLRASDKVVRVKQEDPISIPAHSKCFNDFKYKDEGIKLKICSLQSS